MQPLAPLPELLVVHNWVPKLHHPDHLKMLLLIGSVLLRAMRLFITLWGHDLSIAQLTGQLPLRKARSRALSGAY